MDQISDEEKLPYEDGFFDLIINRHESYSVSEVYRILKTGALFVTQQVGGRNDIGLNKLLGAPVGASHEWGDWDIDWGLGTQSKELEEGGFKVLEGNECFPVSRFFDIGAVVYYLKVIPWQIPDFTVDKYRDALRRLHGTILKEGYVDVASHRFIIVSKKT